MARDGELADRRVPAPPGLRTVLGFSRLSSAAYAIVRRAVDDDDDFRARVAAAADEAAVGRAGWLWLTRPDGWEADPAFETGEDDREKTEGLARLRRERDGAEAAAARHQQAAADAEAGRRRAEEQLEDAVRLGRAQAATEVAALRGDLSRQEEERNGAVRAQKRLEGELAEARRDLRAVRAALVAAEVDLAAARDAPAPPPAHRRTLATPRSRQRGRRGRVRASLPPGVFDDSAEGRRYLVSSGEALLVVDGYNVARTAWSGLTPEEERRRTVALLEEVQARSGGPVVVVFDGDDTAFGPSASRSVRVQFSATGVTADEAMADLLAAVPLSRPVVVVSSDREVAAGARREGAVALGARDFLAAAGR